MQLAREFSNGCIKGILFAPIQTRNNPVFRDKDLGTSFFAASNRMELGGPPDISRIRHGIDGSCPCRYRRRRTRNHVGNRQMGKWCVGRPYRQRGVEPVSDRTWPWILCPIIQKRDLDNAVTMQPF